MKRSLLVMVGVALLIAGYVSNSSAAVVEDSTKAVMHKGEGGTGGGGNGTGTFSDPP